MEYFSCIPLSRLDLVINGRIDREDEIVSVCCQNIENPPRVAFGEKPADTLERYLGMRSIITAAGITRSINEHGGGTFTMDVSSARPL